MVAMGFIMPCSRKNGQEKKKLREGQLLCFLRFFFFFFFTNI